jgi:hypothetical protein
MKKVEASEIPSLCDVSSEEHNLVLQAEAKYGVEYICQEIHLYENTPQIADQHFHIPAQFNISNFN